MNLQPLKRALAQLDPHAPSWDRNPAREEALLAIGRFLESNIRSGQPFDLKTVHPNPLWQYFEERLDLALAHIPENRAPVGVFRIHQWYSSGIILDVGDRVIGFDIVPMRRLYGWEDRFDMTTRLADLLDVLFITHRHEDHYDADLVSACLKAGKTVLMPESLARTWNKKPGLVPVGDGFDWDYNGVRVRVRTGIHVWRETADDLQLSVYELAWPDGSAIVHGGDVDYTKVLDRTEGLRVRAYFLPWRAPNALYEEGDARRIAPLHDAVQMALDRLQPETMFYEHCAELEHVYDGFAASFDMAFDLKHRLPVKSELLFWGEHMDLAR